MVADGTGDLIYDGLGILSSALLSTLSYSPAMQVDPSPAPGYRVVVGQEIPFLDLIQAFEAIDSLFLLHRDPILPYQFNRQAVRGAEARVSQPSFLFVSSSVSL